MGTLKVPDNITSITIGGVALVPSVDHFVVVTADQATGIIPQQSQPKLMGTDLLGNATVKLPPSITAISFDGVAYAADGQNQIVLPPAVVTQFLGAESWHPFWHFDPSGGVPIPPITFNPDTPIVAQEPKVGVPFLLDITGHFQNGPPPVIYSVFSGGLPPGLALNGGTGVVSGTPTTPGNSGNVVFRAQDGKGNSANSNGVPFNTLPSFNIATWFGASRGGWYEFQDTTKVFSDLAGTVPAVADGPVGMIRDKSPNAYHIPAIAVGVRPTYRNIRTQRAGEWRESVPNRMLLYPMNLGNASGMFVCAVVNYWGLGAILESDYDTQRLFNFRWASDGSVILIGYTPTNTTATVFAPVPVHPCGVDILVSASIVGTTMTLRMNGVQVGTAVMPGVMGSKSTELGMGCGSAGGVGFGNIDNANGLIKVAAVIDRGLTLTEIQDAEAYMQQFMDVPTLGIPAWNPADKDADVSIRNDSLNRAAFLYTAGAATGAIRSVTSRTGSGIYRVDFVCTGITGHLVGFGRALATLSNFPGIDANGFAYYGTTGEKYNNGAAVAYGAIYAVGDVISGIVDFGANTITFYKNGVSQGVAFSGAAVSSAPLFAMWGPGTGSIGGRGCTINTGQLPFPSVLVPGEQPWG